jgi:hypothetical protein
MLLIRTSIPCTEKYNEGFRASSVRKERNEIGRVEEIRRRREEVQKMEVRQKDERRNRVREKYR